MAEKFDPRFDPRYQPGYQEQPGDRAGAAASDDEQPRMLISPPQPNEGAAPNSEAVGTELGTEELAELDVNPNPFERTLWIVAVVLVVGGVAVANWTNNLNFMGSSGEWQWPQMIQISAWALSGPMVTIGFATAVGLLFRRAITWKPQE